ncbi:hypothetical protein DBR42_03585 [Pelomonas sp. HMWF004]|nr:hypothetical protein DBR42_03585 [Pelomonas sp. HMWF004]
MKTIYELACVALAGAACLAVYAEAAPAQSSTLENASMAITPSISRPSSPPIAPIDHDGVRYEQGTHDDRNGDQPGGYLTATDIKTGQRLWRLKVYTVAVPKVPGAPAFARYFRTMKLSADSSALEIEDEVGAVYRVDLATRVSTQLSGPPETASPKPAAKPKPKPTP